MPIESTQESRLPAESAFDTPPAHKGSLVRIIVYLLLACGVGLIAWRVFQNQKASRMQAANQAAALMGRPVPVQVWPVEQKAMPIYLSTIGTVMPYMSVTVKARVNGELLPVKFTEGQEVRQGQTIMVIDPKPYQAALDQAKGTLAHDQALLKNAQAEYNRYKALYEAGVVSKETLDTDEAAMGQYQGAIQTDKAAIETAQLQLSWCYIQSPINGRIGLRLVDPGNIIAAGTTNLVVINQFQPIAVYFTLPENDLPQVLRKLATDRTMVVGAYDRGDVQKLATGALLTADNQIDTTTGTAKLKAVFPNQDHALFPNQFVNIHLVMEQRPNALVVPSAAIQSGTQGTFVWTTDTDEKGNTVAKIQPVKVALAEGQLSILDGGVQAGQKIVIDGTDRLRPGQIVQVSAAHQVPAPSGAGQGQGALPPGGPFAAPDASANTGAQPGGPRNGKSGEARKMR